LARVSDRRIEPISIVEDRAAGARIRVCCLTICIILRRPGECPDPYTVPFMFGTLADIFRNHKRSWLWVPAFAGTTQEHGCHLLKSRVLLYRAPN